MLEKISLLKKDEFVKGSLILFIMLNIFNFLNWIFHFSMARMLGAADYGILAVLMSVGYVFGISAEAIRNVISRYTSKLNSKKEYGKMKNLLKRSFRKGFKISFFIFIVYLFLALWLSSFLDIEFLLLGLVGLLIFSDFLFAPIIRGILQGTKQFKKLGISMIIEASIKLLVGIFLVYLGFRVYGAIGAVIFSIFVSIFISLFFLKTIIKSKEKRFKTEKIYSYSLPFFISVISITLIFSLDVIIAKRFFTAEIVGKYAIASLLGKMIFWGTAPIAQAMFPLSSESFENKKRTRNLLYKAAIFLFFLCLAAVIVFTLFPKFIISLLFGSQYTDISKILVFMGISFSILAFTNLIVVYALSKNKSSFSFALPIFAIIEIVLLSVFSASILQYALAFLFSNLLMFFGTIILIKNETSRT